VNLYETISRVDKELLGEFVECTENHRMLQRSHLPLDVLSETHTSFYKYRSQQLWQTNCMLGQNHCTAENNACISTRDWI